MNTKQKRMKYDDKAKKLVNEMSLDEKIKLMGGQTSLLKAGVDFYTVGYNHKPYLAGGNKRLGVPPMKFCDGPRGIVSVKSTCFPVTMGRGASFDTELEERVGEVMGKEVRSVGGRLFGGVCINVPYNPGWGRSQEVYGEDPCHLGKMGVSLVQGVQKHNVIACLKHFAFNSMENARFRVSVLADKRTEREVFLPHFKKCIDAGAAGVMSAYNKYQGEYCGHNNYLLNQTLKQEWEFDGFVISDFAAGVKDTVGGVNGGCDIEMQHTKFYSEKKIKRAMKEGLIKEETITEHAVRIVRTLLATEDAKDPQSYPKGMNGCSDHIAVAKEVADKSITLVKNDKKILPFQESKIRTIALVGDLAREKNIGDHGSSRVRPPYIVTMQEALMKKYSNVKVEFISTQDAGKSQDVIAKADAVIIACGYTHSDEGERISEKGNLGGDRVSLALHQRDLDMLSAIGKMNSNTVTVVFGGNMILMKEWLQSVPAILMAYYPGMVGAYSIMDVIFGKVNPSGKLPFTVPQEEKDLPTVDFHTEDEQIYEYYHGYRKLDKEGKEALLPFGFGLSYTDFEVSQKQLVSINAVEASFSVQVKNKGSMYGGEVVQLYVGYENSQVDRPIKVLKDFQKVYLSAGEETTVTLTVKKEDLAFYDENTSGWCMEDINYIAYIGNDAEDAMKTAIKYCYK